MSNFFERLRETPEERAYFGSRGYEGRELETEELERHRARSRQIDVENYQVRRAKARAEARRQEILRHEMKEFFEGGGMERHNEELNRKCRALDPDWVDV